MRIFTLFFALVLSLSQCYAQSDATTEELVQQGVRLYDQGSYAESLEVFETIIKDNPQHATALYEASMCLFQLAEYKKCAAYCDEFLKYTTEEKYIGHMMKANSLDMMGDKKKAVKAYKTGLKDAPDHYMLCYNLALTLYNMGELDEASLYLQKGIGNQAGHASSHLLLSYIEYDRDNEIKSLMAGDYYLLLDRSSERAQNMYKLLRKIKGSGVSKNGNEIQIFMNPEAGKEDEFDVVTTTWTLLKATDGFDLDDKIEEAIKDSLGVEVELERSLESKEASTNQTLFTLLDEQQKGKAGFWWEFYAEFYADAAAAGHSDALSYLIMENDPDRDCSEWLSANGIAIDACIAWLRAYDHF